MSFRRTAEDLRLTRWRGSNFRFLLDDETFFILDETEDAQLVLWPPERLQDCLPRFLAAQLLTECARRFGRGFRPTVDRTLEAQ